MLKPTARGVIAWPTARGVINWPTARGTMAFPTARGVTVDIAPTPCAQIVGHVKSDSSPEERIHCLLA